MAVVNRHVNGQLGARLAYASFTSDVENVLYASPMFYAPLRRSLCLPDVLRASPPFERTSLTQRDNSASGHVQQSLTCQAAMACTIKPERDAAVSSHIPFPEYPLTVPSTELSMSHYVSYPRLPIASSYAPTPLGNPRDRYLAAVAEVKAAEAEYLAVEALQREEEALRRRLEEVQLHKQEQELLRSSYGQAPYYPSTRISKPDTYAPAGYGLLAALRREVDEEACGRRILEAEVIQGRRRQAEAAQLLPFSRQNRLPGNLAFSPPWKGLLAPKAKVYAPTQSSFVKPVCHYPPTTVVSSLTPASQNSSLEPTGNFDVQGLLNQILGGSKPKTSDEPTPVEKEVLQQVADLFIPPPSNPTKAPVRTREPASDEPTAAEKQMLQQFEDLFKYPSITPKGHFSARMPTPAEDAALELEFANLFLHPSAQTQSTPQTSISSKMPAASLAAPLHSKGAEAFLKEQLESRLHDESSPELRNSIQAIFVSPQDTDSHPITSTSAARNPVGTGIGKAQATGTWAGPSPSAPTTVHKDIVNSVNEIRSIDAALQVLQADFTFPAHVDFLPSHVISGSSGIPGLSGSQASATAHLAYTSPNQTVRLYEQSSYALLAQLDAVESFGSGKLRGMRKEAVNRVEKALDELEREVKGRWEAKGVDGEVTEIIPNKADAASEESVIPPPELVSSQDDSVAVPDSSTVQIEVTVETAVSEDSSTPAPAADIGSEPSNAPAPAVSHSTTSDAVSQPADATVTDINDSLADSHSAHPETMSSTASLSTSSGASSTTNTDSTTTEDAISPMELESTDPFLLSASSSDADSISKRFNSRDSDDGSEWSEVDA
ncbi:hypothetical protein FPV67DRAFT_1448833 [Lyophyllum atratum]|nr:hypothetical protein FPV67DRAFT_1448833 [Lyophyllum atratum]